MSLRLETREFFDAQEYLDKLTDFSEDEDEFLDAQEAYLDDYSSHATEHLESFPLHRLAFDGDCEGLKKALAECSDEDKTRLDTQGNTILHIAILRNRLNVLNVGLESGVSSKVRNARGWSALDEAIAVKQRNLVRELYLHQIKEIKLEVQAAKTSLIQTLSEMPDYSMELNWKLGSPVVGYLLKKFAPHDTYRIYKTGSKIRVDGTLMGIEKNSSSIIPEWKRGQFSLLFDGSHRPSLVFLVFHKTKEYLDLTEEKQERKKNGSVEAEVDLLLGEGVGKTKLRAMDLCFKPVKGWLTSQQTEKIENWNTVVYEASAKMLAVTQLKSNLDIPSNCTFDEYLNLTISEDKTYETAVDPTSIPSPKLERRPSLDGGPIDKKVKPKRISGRCWMAEDFPMSLQQLLPLLEVVGHANKHLSRVSKFMKKYGDMNMFPVKIQVPLLLTVYLLVSFKKFKYSDNSMISMELPRGYVRIKLEDVLSSAALGDLDDKRTDSSSTKNDLEAFHQIERDTIEY